MATKRKVDPMVKALQARLAKAESRIEDVEEVTSRHERKLKSQGSVISQMKRANAEMQEKVDTILARSERTEALSLEMNTNVNRVFDMTQHMVHSFDEAQRVLAKADALDTPVPGSEDTVVKPGPPISETMPGH